MIASAVRRAEGFHEHLTQSLRACRKFWEHSPRRIPGVTLRRLAEQILAGQVASRSSLFS